ncbi:MAG: D-alanine--D-alanine ligase [Pirellulales bacterium]
MKKLRILVPMHVTLVPPDSLEGYSEKEIAEWKTEFDVVHTLREIGHEVRPLGLIDDLTELRKAISDWKPHVAFNLLEEFHSVPTYDQHVVSYLELMRQPYTGCNPRGLLLSHDKELCKKLLTYHRIATPGFVVFQRNRAVKRPVKLKFPLIVKSATEDASLGIAQASIVSNDEKLKDRVAFIFDQLKSDALVEEYIDGRELYVGMIGNDRLQTFPVWEMSFAGMPEGAPRIATRRVKWDEVYQKKYGIMTDAAEDLTPEQERRIASICKRVYRVLGMSGYARMDLRMTEDGRFSVLEANPNPNLSYGEDFSESAEKAGIDYGELLQKIISLGMSYRAAWAQQD